MILVSTLCFLRMWYIKQIEKRESCPCHDCIGSGEETNHYSSTAPASVAKEENEICSVLILKHNKHHFIGKDRPCKNNHPRGHDDDQIYCSVADLQESPVCAVIESLSKILGVKHLKYKDLGWCTAEGYDPKPPDNFTSKDNNGNNKIKDKSEVSCGDTFLSTIAGFQEKISNQSLLKMDIEPKLEVTNKPSDAIYHEDSVQVRVHKGNNKIKEKNEVNCGVTFDPATTVHQEKKCSGQGLLEKDIERRLEVSNNPTDSIFHENSVHNGYRVSVDKGNNRMKEKNEVNYGVKFHPATEEKKYSSQGLLEKDIELKLVVSCKPTEHDNSVQKGYRVRDEVGNNNVKEKREVNYGVKLPPGTTLRQKKKQSCQGLMENDIEFKLDIRNKPTDSVVHENSVQSVYRARVYKKRHAKGKTNSEHRVWDVILNPTLPFSPGHHVLCPAVYPVVNVPVHRLMRYEILRIRSYNRHSTMPSYSVTQLAQNGFYLSGHHEGEVTCFQCGLSHKTFLSGISLNETAHQENCRSERVLQNVGLFMGTQGLTSSDLKLFNTVYGENHDSGKLFIQQEPLEEIPVYYMYTSQAKENPVGTLPDSKFLRVWDEENNLNDGGDYEFLDLSGAAYPLFANQRTRRETFHSWDPTHSQKPDELVKLGFFYAGYSDCSRCFYCGLGLKYWRPNDVAAYQHARFRPQCKYNQFVMGQEFVDNVQRTIAAENQGATANAVATEVPTNMDQLLKSDAVKQVIEEGWSWVEVRAGVTQLVHDLGEECLIYDILVEILINLYGASRHSDNAGESQESHAPPREGHDGEPEDGEDNVLQIGEGGELSQDYAEAANASSSVKSATETPITLEPDVVLRLLEREHNYLQKRIHCRVCGKEKIGCIYLPCGHVVACQRCGDLASNCVLCQKVISAMASIFLS